MGRCSLCMPWLMALVFLVCVTRLPEAQNTASCASNLTPCAAYLNATNPPKSCCDPLKQTVATQLSCLCTLYNTPGFLESLGINVTQALKLSSRCGIKGGLSDCKASAPAPSTPPPATPGGNKGGAGRASFTGLSFLLMFWASKLLC